MPITLVVTSILAILLRLKNSTKLYAKLFFTNLNNGFCEVVLNFTYYSFVPNCRWGWGLNKKQQEENYQDFLKWGGVVFRSFSYNN